MTGSTPLPAVLAVTALALSLPACGKKAPPEPARPSASALASAAASASALPDGKRRYLLDDTADVKFTIDAPLEKITGETHRVRGSVDVDVRDLTKTTGVVEVNVMELFTTTFAEEEKNHTQTEHAHNWLELGASVPPERRDVTRWAKFVVTKVGTSTALADIQPLPGTDMRAVGATATGDFTLHGVTVKKSIMVNVNFSGPPDAPTKIDIIATQGFPLSLVEHDIKPRDALGAFVAGALAKVGKKIDDKVRVTVSLTANPKK